ncbi:MAG TPA: universal stress protein [Jatrophihabitans sp.]|nr:universal stress protein [Jatrophihabitans sp.]
MAGSYQTVLVGTDGSDTSFLAVDRAAALARDAGARLLIVSAYQPADERSLDRERDILGADSYQLMGSAPAEDNVSRARDRAAKAGHQDVETLALQGDPVEILHKVAADRQVDLIVVGNRGLNRLGGRILGSVPADVARRSLVDVLIVHTT